MSNQEAYGPGWIRAVVMVHPSGDIHYIGGDREDGEGDTEYRAAKYLRHASKIVEAAPSASTNSDYAVALEKEAALYDEEFKDHGFNIYKGRAMGLRDAIDIIQRLNSAKPNIA